VYAVQGGSVTVPEANFTSSSVTISGAQPPFVYLGNTTQAYTFRLSYSPASRLRAITETKVVTGVATSISLSGAAYTNDVAKLWIIRSPTPGLQVELAFTTLNTQANADFLTVYNGASQGSPSSLQRIAGSPSPLPIVTSTSGEGMTVLFTSDGSVSNAQGLQGFAADFSFVRRVNTTGNISCTDACSAAANVRYKW
jgi:hypothetical protein